MEKVTGKLSDHYNYDYVLIKDEPDQEWFWNYEKQLFVSEETGEKITGEEMDSLVENFDEVFVGSTLLPDIDNEFPNLG